MLFNSITYIFVFLPLVVLLYWQLPGRARLWLILVASLIFYGFWRFDFIPLVLFSALLDYVLAMRIARIAEPRARRRFLLVSVAANLAILGYFKYLVFFAETGASLARLLGYQPGPVELHIILPLGISFYIFQTLSYTIDVYRREIEPEPDVLKYLCFVTFFGHMVAGPILRARILLPQFAVRPAFRGEFITEGCRRIIAGLMLKVFLADSIADFVNTGFARPASDLGFYDAWTLAFLFGFQIYFDFAGYSHIAIGSARLMGITLPENFDFPYMASSPRAFWQRWHISLSTWIRDYLYLPILGTFHSARDDAWDTMKRVDTASPIRRAAALFITWIIMGLWHGANWTFALWGFYHAMLIQAQRLLGGGGAAGGWRSLVGWSITLPLAMAGWVPFRCATLHDSFAMWQRMIDLTSLGRPSLGLPPNTYLLAAALLIGMLLVWAWGRITPRLAGRPLLRLPLETTYYTATIAIAVTFLQVKTQFIYFQF